MESILFKPSIPKDFCSENVRSVCRICLQTHIPLFLIFRDNIDEMISEFVPDKVDEQDNFPHQICEKCLEDVKIAYAFKKQIEYSYEVIKNLLCGRRLPRLSRRKICKELSPPSVSKINSIKTYFQCHMCKRSMKRKDLLKRHLEKMHKCFDLNSQYDDKFDSEEKSMENLVAGNGIKEALLPSLLKDTEEKIPISNNDENDDASAKRKDGILRSNDENLACNSNKLNFEKNILKKNISNDCNVCHKSFISLYDLKYHLEKQHQVNDANDLDIKPKMIVLTNSSGNEAIEQIESSSVKELLEKNLSYEFSNLNNDISSDYLENNSSTTSLDIPKLENVKSNKTRSKTINAYICHICDKEFSCRTTTRRHLKNIHKFENFEDDIWLSKVYQKTVEAKIYECEICKKVYAKTQDLFRHQLLHSGNPRAKPYSCSMCSKSFSRSNHLKTHVNGVHADLRPFKCLTCEKSFRRTEHLKRHVLICSTGRKRRAKEPTEHRFSCEVCLRKFSTEKAVQDHIDLEHNESRIFSCKYCSENIIGSTEYRKHCKEHYKTSKQFLCSECGGSFRKLQDFKIHLKRHTGEKPFKCQYCDKAFLRPADQHAHERSHTGERNFKCTNCPKAFSTAYKLRVHMRIHTGERPYKCSYCPRAFAKTGDLKIHHKRRHTSERFYCDLCDLGFVQMFNLRQHKRQVHGVDEPPIRTNFVYKVQLPQNEPFYAGTDVENKISNNSLLSKSEDEAIRKENIRY